MQSSSDPSSQSTLAQSGDDQVMSPSPLDGDAGRPVGIDQVGSFLLEVVVFVGAFYVIFAALSHLLTSPAGLRFCRIGRGVALDVTCKLVSSLFAVLCAGLGCWVMTGHPNSPHIYPAATGYFLYDLYAMYKVFAVQRRSSSPSAEADGDAKPENGASQEAAAPAPPSPSVSVTAFVTYQPTIVLHHAVLAFLIIPLMSLNQQHEPGDLMLACAMIFEASTPFVSLRAILSNLDLKASRIYMVNGLAMVVVFLCCRVLVFPFFYYTYGQQRGWSMLEAVARTPRHCAVFMWMMLLPQLYWLVLMISGACKVMQERKQKKEK